MKTCNKCEKAKESNEFKKDPRNKDGLQGICKSCNKEWQQQRRDARASGSVQLKEVAEKKCNKCENVKTRDQFYKDVGMSDGLATICKACRNETMSAWRDNNRDKYNKNMRDLRANNPGWAKNTDLKRTHNITLQEYNKMLEDQENVCAICKGGAKGKRPLVVDHDHSTGKVRQLLCYGCNRALHVLEDKSLFDKATGYLKKHK